MSTHCSGGQKARRYTMCACGLGEGVFGHHRNFSLIVEDFDLASRVISAKRAHLSGRMSSGIVFVRDNVALLRKHYARVTAKDENALSLELCGIPVPKDEHMAFGCDLFADNICF